MQNLCLSAHLEVELSVRDFGLHLWERVPQGSGTEHISCAVAEPQPDARGWGLSRPSHPCTSPLLQPLGPTHQGSSPTVGVNDEACRLCLSLTAHSPVFTCIISSLLGRHPTGASLKRKGSSACLIPQHSPGEPSSQTQSCLAVHKVKGILSFRIIYRGGNSINKGRRKGERA